MKTTMKSFLPFFILLAAMLGTPAFAQTSMKATPTPTVTVKAPVVKKAVVKKAVVKETSMNQTDDADRYLEREAKAAVQSAFNGGDGVIIGVTATGTAVILLIILLILL